MTDKVQKICEEVERLQKRAEHNFDISLTENEREYWLGEFNGLTLIGKYIDTMQEEPVSEDVVSVAKQYVDSHVFGNEEDKFTRSVLIDMFCSGVRWQKQQDQSTIELAEDHAMLAGMEKMKEQMMAKAVETTFNVSLPSGLYDKLWIKGCKECDKLLVIKKDEL